MISNLAGQWIGQTRGDPNGFVVIDLDSVGSQAIGHAYIYPHDNSILASCAVIDVEDKLVATKFEADVVHFHSDFGVLANPQQLGSDYPDNKFPRLATINLEPLNSNELRASWNTEQGTHGECTLTRMESNSWSKLLSEAEVVDWRSYQDHVTTNFGNGFVFRGQAQPWPVRSAFHRTTRKNLQKYIDVDIPSLHRALTGRTNHLFDLQRPQEYGAFLSLAQHHGFPTPLIDWTYSPYVAAFFAFEKAQHEMSKSHVRVFAFDMEAYRNRIKQFQTLAMTTPHFSFLEALSIENNRSIPQQGLLALTNLEDVEGFIEFLEREGTQRYLFAFDIPYSERDKALSDLRLMGLTRATLFPGIESICGELKYRLFD